MTTLVPYTQTSIRTTTPADRMQASLVERLVEMCPTCGYPFASSFKGYEYVLSGQECCNGSLSLGVCVPTKYLAVAIPGDSMEWDFQWNGRRFRGVLYEVRE